MIALSAQKSCTRAGDGRLVRQERNRMFHAQGPIELPERWAWIGGATYVLASAGSGGNARKRPAVRPGIVAERDEVPHEERDRLRDEFLSPRGGI